MEFAVPGAVAERVRQVRALVDAHALPLEARFVVEDFAALEPALEEARGAVRAAGLFAPGAPAEHGGGGVGLLEFALLSEPMGRSPLGHYLFNAQAPDAGNIELLAHHGSAEQKDRWLGPLVAGELRSCFAMTEPDTPGSNPVMLACRATRDGHGWVLDGTKWFATGADGAAFIIVMAVTDPEGPPRDRATLFLVPAGTAGLRRVRNIPVMGHAGSGWHSHSELEFVGCRIPDTARIGEVGEGFALAQARLAHGRVHHCMRWLGIGARALEMLCDRARERVLRPGRTLAETGAAERWVAESAAELEAARWMTLAAAWKIETAGAAAARREISLLKFHVAGVLGRVLDRAVQAHGALGLTDDTILAYFYRAERAARIYDGPDEVHQKAAARSLLRGDPA